MKLTHSLRQSLPRAGALALAGLLTACGSMAPDYERPASPVAARFSDVPAAASNAAQTTAVDDVPWQAFFADATLRELIQAALNNNRDLRIAALTVAQYRAQANLKEADRWPTINAGIGVSRSTTVGVPLSTVYQAGVQVTNYEVDLYGRLHDLSNAAQAQYLASVEAHKAAQISLIGAVANAAIALRNDLQLLQLAEQTAANREASLKLMGLRLDNGAASLLDMSQAETLFNSANASLAQARRQARQDQNALEVLIGGTLTDAQLAALGASTDTPLAAISTPLQSDLLLRRPDVMQAEQQLIAANANIGAARAAYFPSLTLSTSAGSASTDLATLFQSGTYAWAVAPQLLMPIFDGGRNKANVAAATAARDIAVAQYEKAIQAAFREVADALNARTTLEQQYQAQQALTRSASHTADLTTLRLRNGASSYSDVLDAQRTLYAAQQAQIQVQGQIQQNMATLYRVLGGGWAPSPAKTPSD